MVQQSPISTFNSSAQIAHNIKPPHKLFSLCESMESSSSSRTNSEKMVKKVIWPAIRGQSCPICLKDLEARRAAVLTACNHAYCVECIRKWSSLKRKCPLCNAHFDSWFCNISLSSRTFYKERLPASNNNIRNDDVEVGLSRIGHRR